MVRLLVLAALVAAPAWAEPDWEALTGEAAQVLSQYVRIDTTNPPGNELAAARFLEQVLARNGIGATVYQSAENRGNLLARLPGRGRAQPIILLHHMDVVPAAEADWSFEPLSGEISDGFVHGRGTLDDKGPGVMQLMGLLAHQRQGRACGRDLVLLAVADEEVDGVAGVRFMVERYPEQVRAAAVWNEGGASVEGIVAERPVNSIAVTEKNSLWITIVAVGEGGHGSAPSPDGAINVLTAALTRIAAWETPIHLVPAMRTLFRRLGSTMFPGGGFLMSHLDQPLLGRVAAKRVTQDRLTNGLVRNTIALTGIRGGLKHNIIPNRAEADLDVRLLPDQEPKEFLAQLQRVIDDPRVTIMPVQYMPRLQPASPAETPFFAALERALGARLPAGITVPGMLTGSSDCTAFRAVGTPCYGYSPIVGSSELLRRIHGPDERLSLANLRLGIQVTYDVLQTLCAE
ncbi:MAG: M20/M25/M40 family metallo-hydrolase [Deltaproteobacteria bacterium]|nr:M20/M25/M40 family metallo-hydrolase [Deltaproteobacteria bacterium]